MKNDTLPLGLLSLKWHCKKNNCLHHYFQREKEELIAKSLDYDNGFTNITNLIEYVEKTSVPYQQKINSTIYKIRSFQTDLRTDKATFQRSIEELNELEVFTKQQKERELKDFDNLKNELKKLNAKNDEQHKVVTDALDKMIEAQQAVRSSKLTKGITKAIGGGVLKLSGSITSFISDNKTAGIVNNALSAIGKLTTTIGAVVAEFNGADITEVVSKLSKRINIHIAFIKRNGNTFSKWHVLHVHK